MSLKSANSKRLTTDAVELETFQIRMEVEIIVKWISFREPLELKLRK